MQENDVNKTYDTSDADDAFLKEKVNEFAKDMASFFDQSEKSKKESVELICSISEHVGKIDRCIYGVRYDIDHLDTRLRDLVLLTRELKTLEKKKKGNINTIVLLLALIFIALFSLGVFLCLG